MDIFRIGHGPFRGLIGVCCHDDSLEIFKSAKNLAYQLLDLTSSSDAKEDRPTDIQEYLNAAGHRDSPWQYLCASGAQGLGLGSNQKKVSRAAFLALALHKASMSKGEVPNILQGPLESAVLTLHQISRLLKMLGSHGNSRVKFLQTSNRSLKKHGGLVRNGHLASMQTICQRFWSCVM